jgi:Domain of unknown function (DUF3598)
MTLSQWDCLLKNLGCWQGSFTRVSVTGKITEDIRSETILEGRNENKTIQQIIRQFYPSGTQEKILEYSALARSILLFENGAFSQGSTQLGFNSEFGAELGLIDSNSRRRLVQLFDKNGELSQLTYIRETLSNTEPQISQTIGWEQLQGKWQCQVVTLYADWRSPDRFTTETVWINQSRTSIIGNKLNSDIKPLFLPDGVASICPAQIKLGQPVSLEVLWMTEPDIYHQMIRTYDDRGGWISLTLAIAIFVNP